MATDYDELRTDVKESQDSSLEALKSAKAPDAKSVVLELDEADTLDGLTPVGEFIAEELVVQVIPRQTTSSLATPASWSATAHRRSAKRTVTGTALSAKAE